MVTESYQFENAVGILAGYAPESREQRGIAVVHSSNRAMESRLSM